jgi:4-hydroxybenzoate polyprenyltransferase
MRYLQLIRVYQWPKNFFIFAPLFFSGNFLDLHKLQDSIIAFIFFSIIASAIYIINDYKDIEKDKCHPVKKNRPLASGLISKTTALILFCILSIISLISVYIINKGLFYVLLTYFLLNIAYSFFLKSIPLIDVFIIAIGFVLRIIAGGIVTSIEISHWLYIMTFLLALFIAFAKRRDDVLLQQKTGEEMRKSISGYNLDFINSSISVLCGTLIVSYILYITSPEITQRFQNKHAFISVLFVVAGVLRYMQITLVEKNSGAPSKILLKDFFIQITILLWISFFCILIYLK